MTPLVLLAFLGTAAGGAAPALPARIDGWKLAAPPARYNAENLFEFIDGGAESFLQFDFQDLTAASYLGADKTELTVNVFHHQSPARAFGMYTQERRPGSPKMSGKIEGIAGEDHLEFVVGAYYVKLALPGGGEASLLPKFAEKLAAKLPGTREQPAMLGYFPDQGKRIRAERLTARDFLGHAFLHDAAAAPYDVGGAHFRLFVVEGKDASDVRAMVSAYRSACKLPAADIAGEGSLTLKDPLNGEVLLSWAGRWLWGAVDDSSPARKALVDELGRRLPLR